MKKTPREILIERHRSAQSKLDAIRREVLERGVHAASALAAGAPRAASPPSGAPTSSFLINLWLELIWPARRIWVGFAAIWILIFALNVKTGEPRMSAAQDQPASTPEMRTALQEQQQLLAELMNGDSGQTSDRPRFIPRPRSEEQPTTRMA